MYISYIYIHKHIYIYRERCIHSIYIHNICIYIYNIYIHIKNGNPNNPLVFMMFHFPSISVWAWVFM